MHVQVSGQRLEPFLVDDAHASPGPVEYSLVSELTHDARELAIARADEVRQLSEIVGPEDEAFVVHGSEKVAREAILDGIAQIDGLGEDAVGELLAHAAAEVHEKGAIPVGRLLDSRGGKAEAESLGEGLDAQGISIRGKELDFPEDVEGKEEGREYALSIVHHAVGLSPALDEEVEAAGSAARPDDELARPRAQGPKLLYEVGREELPQGIAPYVFPYRFYDPSERKINRTYVLSYGLVYPDTRGMERESRLKYSALAPAIGALITVMNGLNSRFSDIVGKPLAAISIHVAGLVAISAILLAKHEERRPGKLPFYYYAGGVIGVGTVFCSNYAFSCLGASLSVALALLGQTLFSLAADATGMLGREKYPLRSRRLPGIGLALAGAAIMAGPWRANAPAMIAALAAGAIPGLSFVLNAGLGRKKGLFRSTRMNYITGLATSLAVLALIRPPLAPVARAFATAGPFLALGGGLMGVAVVSAMNLIIPRMPVFSATILIFCGQAAAGLLIDIAASGSLDARKLVGTAILVSGLAMDAALGRALGRRLRTAAGRAEKPSVNEAAP